MLISQREISCWRHLAALGSAGLMVLALPKIEWAFLGLCALIPLRLAVQGLSAGRAALVGYLYGLATSFGLLYWVANVMETYGGLTWWLAGLVLAIFGAALAIYPAAWAALTAWAAGLLPAGDWRLTAFSALAWVGLEWVRSWFLSGFPWEDLGYVLTPWPLATQMADLGGVALASLVVALTNFGLADLAWADRSWRKIAFLALLWTAVLGYGHLRLDLLAAEAAAAPKLVVRVAQGNIDQARKWDEKMLKEALSRYSDLSLKAHNPRPNLIVWPETSVTFYFQPGAEAGRPLADLARETGSWLLFGAPAYARNGPEIRYYNRAWLVSPAGRAAGYLDKAHLVPYGEYVPLKQFLPFLGKIVAQVGDYSAGEPGRVIQADFGPVGVLICYESIFPELARRQARNGAALLTNITNDAWFGRSSAPYQHLSMLTWRAVENRRAIARSAQTGISALIGPDGRIGKSLDLGLAGEVTGDLPLLGKETIYGRGGWLVGPAGLVLAAALAIRARFGRRYRLRRGW